MDRQLICLYYSKNVEGCFLSMEATFKPVEEE